MAFDLEAARKAGYKDEEIAQFLASQHGFDLQGAIKSGYKPSEVLAYLSGIDSEQKPDAPIAPQPSYGANNIQDTTQIGSQAPRTLSSVGDQYFKSMEAGAARDRESVKQMAGNFPKSLFNVASSIYHAITNPVETAKSVYGVAAGGVEKLIPGEQGDEPNFDAMVKHFAERYGGRENARKTIETDPAGFLVDLSSVLTGVGGATRATAAGVAKTGLAPNAAAAVGEAGKAIADIGAKVEPISATLTAAANTASGLIPKTGKFSPEGMYESALKPSTTMAPEQRLKIVTTALEEKLNTSRESVYKAKAKIDEIDKYITNFVENNSGRGSVHLPLVLRSLDDLKEFASSTLSPDKYLEEIAKVEKDVIKAFGSGVTPEKALVIKKATYKELSKFYDEFQRSMEIEAKKAVASGLKDAVYSLYPELESLGAKESALIALKDSLTQAAGRISNRDYMGIGLPAKAAAGALVGDKVGGGIGALLGVLDAPQVKSSLAIALYRARKGASSIPGSSVRDMLYQADKIEEESRR